MQLFTWPEHLLEPNVSPDQFWFEVLECEVQIDNETVKLLKDLAIFSLEVLTTFHGNADAERSFSAQNNCLTKIRNKMVIETLDATLRAQEYIKLLMKNGIFIPSESLIDLFLKKG